ncbi:MAG: hypothetical protein EBU90_08870 [Proteobacteria bacterium]|nr:hypothetical protein [Pseudomonadota bacterium]NBP13611.1 hypothetical protein [bacterium]
MYGLICINSFLQWARSVPTQNIILIEPRKNIIDQIKPALNVIPHVILIPKLLIHDNTPKEQTVYVCDTQGSHTYLVNYPSDTIVVRKEKCYTTSLCNIIREHKIQVIDKLIINLPVDNTKDILINACVYDHIISHLQVQASPFFDETNADFLKPCFRKDTLKTKDNYSQFVNKNLNVPLPKIAMFLTEPVSESCQSKFDLLVAQYNITVLTLPYLTKGEAPYEFTANSLESIFANPTLNGSFDMFMQFNPRYLNNSDVFKLLFPLKPDVIYLNRPYDIIYTTKNGAHMLYQILKSTYFTDHMSDLERNRKAIFRLFRKQYFYDYISKIFVIKNYT